VFGFRVDASSARLLGGLLIALLVFALAAVGAAAYLWMKLRGANRTNVSQ
jgi:hypothetical protein